ncbi:MAG: prolipoprotein diacylglyceryl transferase [Nitrososphaerales archaeon]
MKPIPVAFHIGPLEVHTYGIGLAITFWFAYRYFERRLRNAGYPWQWLTGVFLWIVVASIVGARVLHVLANWSTYQAHPSQILAIWQGGLSSFGGLLFGVPVGVILARRRCPQLPSVRALDLVSPVLMAAWGVGRLLGPQLMIDGGGRRTTAWWGLRYAGEAGKRVPVPLIQAFDSFVIFAILILIEHYVRKRPVGFVLAATAALWGLARFFEENVFLKQNDHNGAPLVQAAGLLLFAGGVVAMAVLWRRHPPSVDESGSDDAGDDSVDLADDNEPSPAPVQT